MKPLKVISMWQPWCWAMTDPVADKANENRDWPAPISLIDQVVAIHAAKQWDNRRQFPGPVSGELVTPTGFMCELKIPMPARRETYPAGVITGLMIIDRVVSKPDTLAPEHRRWFFGPFGWYVPLRLKLETEHVCKGRQGIFHAPDDIAAAIRSEVARRRAADTALEPFHARLAE